MSQIAVSGIKPRPAGATTQVQYNNAGAFAGSANFTYDSATNTLTTGSITGSGLSMEIMPRAPTVIENAGTLWFFGSKAVKANSDGGNIQFISGLKTGTGQFGRISFSIPSGVTFEVSGPGVNIIGANNSSFSMLDGDVTFTAGVRASIPSKIDFYAGYDDAYVGNGPISFWTDSGPQLQVSESVFGTPELAFFGATLTAKPNVTGSKGGNAALASLITALATLGLVTDSTTA